MIFDISLNGTVVGTMTTDANGTATSGELPAGKYDVVERSLPAGYTGLPFWSECNVTSNNTTELKVTNQPIQFRVTIIKTDAQTSAPLSGAEFTITRKSGLPSHNGAGMGLSPKTKNGGLSSATAFKGLLKKVLILCAVGLAALIDKAVTQGTGIEIAAVTGVTCFWFVASEGLSVVENAAAIGVPIPKVLLRALEIMKQQGNGGEEHKPPDALGEKNYFGDDQ